jgi:gas vesicle protein
MARFLLAFVLGLSIGAAIALLLSPEPGNVNREKLRKRTDEYASGEETLMGTLLKKIDGQRHRFELALEVGRLASEKRQEQLWSQLKLTPPEKQVADALLTPDGA